MRPHRRATPALLVAAATIIPIAAAEIWVRQSGRFEPPPYPPRPLRPDLFTGIKGYGYGLRPARTTTYLYPRSKPRRLTLTSDRYGFRNSRDLFMPDDRPRVLVLGDSFVFGHGVEEHERFTEALEALEPRWRVDNLGMTGFGADLMLRALETVGVYTRPNVVVFSMYTDSFRRVSPQYSGVGFPIPRFTLRNGELVSVPYPQPPRLRIVEALRRIRPRDTMFAFELNGAILDRFHAVAKAHRFAAALLFLPGTADTPVDVRRRRWLAEYATGRGTPFLDLTASIHGSPQPAFIERNWHLNPLGHGIVAGELRPFLVANFLELAAPGSE